MTDLKNTECFWSSSMHLYLCLCSIYLLFIFVSSSPIPSSWLWHVLHCLVLDMSFVLTFALRFAIWSIISCFLILALPSSHLPSGWSTLLCTLQPHIHNFVAPYTAGGVRYFFRKQGCDVHKSLSSDFYHQRHLINSLRLFLVTIIIFLQKVLLCICMALYRLWRSLLNECAPSRNLQSQRGLSKPPRRKLWLRYPTVQCSKPLFLQWFCLQ